MATWSKVAVGLLAILASAYACSLFVGWLGSLYVLLAAVIGATVQLFVRRAPGIGLAFLVGLAFLSPVPWAFLGPPVAGLPLISLLFVLFYAPIIAAVAALTVGALRGDFRALKRHGP